MKIILIFLIDTLLYLVKHILIMILTSYLESNLVNIFSNYTIIVYNQLYVEAFIWLFTIE